MSGASHGISDAATGPKGSDYALSPDDADALLGALLLPADSRERVLVTFLEERGAAALVRMFAGFMGLGSSVIANNREMIEVLLITEAGHNAWSAASINLPDIFGALNGVKLAAGIDDPAELCQGCVFRLGSIANQSSATTCAADQCSQSGVESFWCYEDLDSAGRATRVCRGFSQARQRRKEGR
jgi:hypothetical protein